MLAVSKAGLLLAVMAKWVGKIKNRHMVRNIPTTEGAKRISDLTTLSGFLRAFVTPTSLS